MMQLKTQEFIKDLANEDVKDVTVGKALSNIVLMIKSDPLRAYVMAQKLYSENVVELSLADFDWIKTAIKDHGREAYANALIPGQLLVLLSKLEKNQTEKKEDNVTKKVEK